MYPENVPNNFINRLASVISLPGEWVVGISEIHFPCKFKEHIDKSRLSNTSNIAPTVDIEPENATPSEEEIKKETAALKSLSLTLESEYDQVGNIRKPWKGKFSGQIIPTVPLPSLTRQKRSVSSISSLVSVFSEASKSAVALSTPNAKRPKRARILTESDRIEAEDGIRDATVTGVQTCALPI